MEKLNQHRNRQEQLKAPNQDDCENKRCASIHLFWIQKKRKIDLQKNKKYMATF